jgi:hypothetical protein
MINVKKDPVLGTFSIQGLDSDQLAYLTGVVGMSHSRLNADGVVVQDPMMPTAEKIYPALSASIGLYGLKQAADAVERSQWRWTNRLSLRERRERVAS